ncbi:MAG: M14 family zinc carboxypeptidase [Methylococcaceae bacterium]
MNARFPELRQLEHLIRQFGDKARTEIIETVHHKKCSFPIYSISLGSTDANAPVLAFFGGVHGLEKIGSEVILSYMETLSQLLDWDEELHQRLQHSRLLFVPIVNPVGVCFGTRCNGNGVDLMRNSPVIGEGATRLYSGQSITPHLPWYCGDSNNMEKEARALCDVVQKHIFNSPLSIAVDLHSGFGIKDRLWFPYASRKTPFAYIAQAYALKLLFDRCYPHHVYRIEPMCQEYVINGDLWDYLLDEFVQQSTNNQVFMPLTLEMGSWLWLRKNPTHLFSRYGLFHPLLPHRQQRVFRRHFLLFDFLHRSLLYPKPWAQLSVEQKIEQHGQAIEYWYE